MSYFMEDAFDEIREWLKEFEGTLTGEDRIVWSSGLSHKFHSQLLNFLADKLFQLRMEEYGDDL